MKSTKIFLRLLLPLLCFVASGFSQNISYANNTFYLGNSCVLGPLFIVVCSDEPTFLQIKNESGFIYFSFNKTGSGCDTIFLDHSVYNHCVGLFTINSTNRLLIEADKNIILYEGYLYSPREPYPTHYYFRLVPPLSLAGSSNIMTSYTKEYYDSNANINRGEYSTELFLLGIQDTSYLRIYPKWSHPLLSGNNYYSATMYPNGSYFERLYNFNNSPVFPFFYPPCIVTQDSSVSIKGKFITRTGMWGFGSGVSTIPWGLSVGYYFYPLAYEFLGNSYHTVPHLTRVGDSLMAIAFHDNTLLSLNGSTNLLQRGDVFRTLLDSPGVWQANHPFSLVQISRHQQEDSVLYSSLFAYSVHPDSALITSTWYTTEIVPDSTPGEQSYLNLISPTNGVAHVKLDGVSQSSFFSPYPNDTAWSYAQIPVTSVQHKLEADSGVLAYAYQYSLGCGIGFYVGGLEMKNTVTAIQEVENNYLNVYPNPAYHLLFIDMEEKLRTSEKLQIHIYSIDGRKVYSHLLQTKERIQVDVSTLESGLYLIEMQSKSKKYVGKFVKN